MKTIELATEIRNYLSSKNKTVNIYGTTGFILPKNHSCTMGQLNLLDENLDEYSFCVIDYNEQGNPIKKFKVTIENQLPEKDLTLDDKISYQVNHYHKEVSNQCYSHSESGEKFENYDIKIVAYLKIDDNNYKHVCVKQSEIGVLYDEIIDDRNSKKGVIVLKNKH